MSIRIQTLSKTLSLFVLLGTMAACAAQPEPPKPMMMGQCDPARCTMCAERMKMGDKMDCPMMKAGMQPHKGMMMPHQCMRSTGAAVDGEKAKDSPRVSAESKP